MSNEVIRSLRRSLVYQLMLCYFIATPAIIYFLIKCVPDFNNNGNILILFVGLSFPITILYFWGLIHLTTSNIRHLENSDKNNLNEIVLSKARIEYYNLPQIMAISLFFAWLLNTTLVMGPLVLFFGLSVKNFGLIMIFAIFNGIGSYAYSYPMTENTLSRFLLKPSVQSIYKKDLEYTQNRTLVTKYVSLILAIALFPIGNTVTGIVLAFSNNISLHTITAGFAFLIFESIILSIIIGNLIAKNIKQSISTISDFLEKLVAKEGDLNIHIPILAQDEIGKLAYLFNRFILKLQGIINQVKQQCSTVTSASVTSSTTSNHLATNTKQTVMQAESVSSTTEELSNSITSIASSVEQMSTNAHTVASAADQMSNNMVVVSDAVGKLSDSVNSISGKAKDVKNVSNNAMAMTTNISDIISKLTTSATEIGRVIASIKRIAEQTNLLALNATIEAASAGSAGKGFAVVANEIKELANQSSQATNDIAEKINSMQTSSNSAVTVLEEVSEIIVTITEGINSITESVEEQTHVSNEISGNCIQASEGTKNIAHSISEVAKGVGDISKNTIEAANATTNVSENISEIHKAFQDNNKNLQHLNTTSQVLTDVVKKLNVIVATFNV